MSKRIKKPQPLVYRVTWDVLAAMASNKPNPYTLYKGDIQRLRGSLVPRAWSVTLEIIHRVGSKTKRYAHTYTPDSKLFLSDLMAYVSKHVDEKLWDEIKDFDFVSFSAMAVAKRG